METQVQQQAAAGKPTDWRVLHALLRGLVSESPWWPHARKLALALFAALMLLAAMSSTAFAAEGLGVTGTFGSEGPGNGQFNRPRGIAVSEVGASKGDVYVADKENNRVEIFSADGVYLSEFAFSHPEGIAVDSSASVSDPSKGDVYVFSGDTVDKFSATGEPIFHLSPALVGVEGIATDPSGDVWVVGFNQVGVGFEAFVQEFSDAVENAPAAPVKVSIEENHARGIAVDSDENLYIIGNGGGIHKFSKTGVELGTVCSECAHGVAVEPGTNDLFANQITSVAQYGPFGVPFGVPTFKSKPGILTNGKGVAVNATSHQVYAVDEERDHVLILERGSGPEAPETSPASGETGKTAVLHGKLKPPTTEFEYYFEYNTGSSCVGGSRTPLLKGEGEVSEEVTGLQPSAKYTYCLIAENNYTVGTGNEEPFETGPAAPGVISESIANTSQSRGELSAVINPDNQETTYSFEYSTQGKIGAGETLGGFIETIPGAEPLPPEFSERTVSVGNVHLTSYAETYYYRVATENTAHEKTVGKVQSYTKVPIVAGESYSDLTSTSVKLAATINPAFQGTRYAFEYAASEESLKKREGTVVHGHIENLTKEQEELCPGMTVEGGTGTLPEEISEPCPATAEVLSLQPGHIYYYRVLAENETTENPDNENAGLPATGTIESFETFAAPQAVTTTEAQNITSTSATLSGTVNPKGTETTYSFQYISKTAYQAALASHVADAYIEGETTTPVSAGSGETPVAAGPTQASGLRPGETYHYRLLATNRYGVQSIGGEATFTTTSATPPSVSTGTANGVSQNTATLYGTVTTNGLQTNYGFEIGTEPFQPGTHVPPTGLGSIGGALTEEVHVTLDELEPGTTYYYRVTATNADGTIQGEPGSFTTPGFPTLISPPASPAPFTFTKVAFPTETGTTGTGTGTKPAKKCKAGYKRNKAGKCVRTRKKAKPRKRGRR